MLLLWLLACTDADGKAPDDTAPGDTAPDDSADSSPDDETGETGETGEAGVETVLLSSYWTGEVWGFDRASGEVRFTWTGLTGAQAVEPAPDGTVLVCAEGDNRVVRVDPATGAILGVVVGDDPKTAEDESGGLHGPTSARFAPDGTLWVASFEDDRVLRYDADGLFLGEGVAAGAGGLDGPDIGLAFGPEGELYVPSWYTSEVLRYDAATGAFVEVVVGPGDGLDRPREVEIGADGALWVSGWGSDAVYRRDPTTGVVEERLAVRGATGVHLDEAAGAVLVANDTTDSVKAFDPESGEALGVVANGKGVDGATALTVLRLP